MCVCVCEEGDLSCAIIYTHPLRSCASAHRTINVPVCSPDAGRYYAKNIAALRACAKTTVLT